MAHREDSFWVSVFRKSPIIGSCMAVCGIIGCVGGMLFFAQMAPFVRAYICALISCTLGGAFVGLVIGVALDSLFTSLFPKNKKKRRDRWSSL